MLVRYPVVAGLFYEASGDSLKRQVESLFLHSLGPGELPKPVVEGEGVGRVSAIVSPHAGYMYSGPVAAHGFKELADNRLKPDVFVILGPNHSGVGSMVSVMPHSKWITPLGEAVVEEEVSKIIVRESGVAEFDELAHRNEHSIEVQLPFLQYLYGEVKMVAVTFLIQNPDVARDVASAIKKASENSGKSIFVIASSDFTHYEPYESAERKDRAAIEAIKSLEPRRLYETVVDLDVSMCGVAPVMVAMEYSRICGYSNVKLLKYATSGDVTGDKSSVVGYASIGFYR